MKAYAYFETISGFKEDSVIERWRESWKSHGWDPVIIGRDVAERSPVFDTYLQIVRTLPTVNPRHYEEACYLRWMAMQCLGGGFMCDYDVMNNGFTSEHARMHIPARDMVFFEGNGVPSCVFGNETAYTRAVALFAMYEPDEKDVYAGRPHVSDQDISCRKFLEAGFKLDRRCRQYGDIGWEKSPLIHFSNASTGGQKMTVLEKWLANES